ncbi:MAG: DUF4123 domain-containing protein, partial [Candidatus Competibacter sp.]|nr:DUF4123 domain-containing protein [Candidatus Competibacter sp.]
MVAPKVAPNPAEIVSRHLFADASTRVYAVLDGAAVLDLPEKFREYQVDPVCLYRGELTPALAKVAPYQITLERESPVTHWLLREGW